MENVNVSVDAGQNLTSLIEKLASKIGTTADRVFPWFVQQQLIEGWFFVIFVSLFLVIGLLLITFSIRKADFKDGNEANIQTVLVCVGIVVVILTLFAAAIGMSEAVSQIMNPNYHAMQDFISQLSRLKLA